MQFNWGAATDSGLVRVVNEDALLAEPPVFLVADGMGGHASGAIASAIVVEEFAAPTGSTSVTPDWVIAAFQRSHDRIASAFVGGTTVAGFAAVQQHGTPYWLVFNIGDSRVYRCAKGEVTQVSVDHSVVQELVDLGEVSLEKARFHPQRHVITRAVGAPDGPRPDFWLLPAVSGDRLMICSDGVTSELDAEEIARLTKAAAGLPQTVAESLVATALRQGGRDNITVVVVDVVSIESGSDGSTLGVIPDSRSSTPDDRTVPRSLVSAGGGR